MYPLALSPDGNELLAVDYPGNAVDFPGPTLANSDPGWSAATNRDDLGNRCQLVSRWIEARVFQSAAISSWRTPTGRDRRNWLRSRG